jgi:hypothetical protein
VAVEVLVAVMVVLASIAMTITAVVTTAVAAAPTKVNKQRRPEPARRGGRSTTRRRAGLTVV